MKIKTQHAQVYKMQQKGEKKKFIAMNIYIKN